PEHRAGGRPCRQGGGCALRSGLVGEHQNRTIRLSNDLGEAEKRTRRRWPLPSPNWSIRPLPERQRSGHQLLLIPVCAHSPEVSTFAILINMGGHRWSELWMFRVRLRRRLRQWRDQLELIGCPA